MTRAMCGTDFPAGFHSLVAQPQSFLHSGCIQPTRPITLLALLSLCTCQQVEHLADLERADVRWGRDAVMMAAHSRIHFPPPCPWSSPCHDLPEEPEGFDAVADAVADGATVAKEPAE